MVKSAEDTLQKPIDGPSMQIPEGTETEVIDRLSIPSMLLHGQTPEERRNYVLFCVVIRAYMRNDISMMKAGELLGCRDYKSTCRLFKDNNVPTIKLPPEDIQKESKRNREELEKQLGL
jgi:hypothetical protein